MKFKVGDRVRVKTWDELIKEGYGMNESGNLDVGADAFTRGMAPLGGKVYTVCGVGMTVYRLKDTTDRCSDYHFTEEMVEAAPAERDAPTDAAIEVLAKMKAAHPDAPKEEHNAVEHPNHYTAGGIECIDAIRASLGRADFASYCKGNVLKYLWRYRLKNGVEDLKKARVYLGWMIDAEEKSEGCGE